MKTNILLIVLTLSFGLNSTAAIYGDDDRRLVFSNSTSYTKQLSLSIAAKLRSKPKAIGNNKYVISTKPLNEHVNNLCPGEKFEKAETSSNCTAFLVGEDLMVTAGHCINTQEECDNSTWLFSSEIAADLSHPIVDKADFVTCKKLINRVKNSFSKNDWAIFKVSKSTKLRPILKFRTAGKINNNAKLSVIGHPSGLPLIITDENKITNNDSEFLFKINSDTFGGNSGSPVFNEETGLVEGILTDGDSDYRLNKSRGCMEAYKCTAKTCKGENVVRITNIPELVPNMTPKEPIFDPKRPRL